mmetsp:Transcript_6263/g.13950  ORF Transcript_6263/g.13950 Transcript_6263/m.13950 type:complete len:81 (-) Transcript_6263:132-374(-)
MILAPRVVPRSSAKGIAHKLNRLLVNPTITTTPPYRFASRSNSHLKRPPPYRKTAPPKLKHHKFPTQLPQPKKCEMLVDY